MGGGYLSDAAFFYLVRPVQEGVHSLPPGANPGAYRHFRIFTQKQKG